MAGFYDRLGAGLDAAALLLCRISLAGGFWRAGR